MQPQQSIIRLVLYSLLLCLPTSYAIPLPTANLSATSLSADTQFYEFGEYVAIDLPSDQLFEPNTAILLPTARPLLEKTANLLAGYPQNKIFISGHTSGFDRYQRESILSKNRAQKIATYLRSHRINATTLPEEMPALPDRIIRTAGYANRFPIASDRTANGISANNHIHITAYP